jgi:hypothetical protein
MLQRRREQCIGEMRELGEHRFGGAHVVRRAHRSRTLMRASS